MASPLLEQFRKGGVSRDVRMTAATGVLPLTTSDQAELLCLLTRDRDEEIRQNAEKSLAAIAEDDLLGVRDRSESGHYRRDGQRRFGPRPAARACRSPRPTTRGSAPTFRSFGVGASVSYRTGSPRLVPKQSGSRRVNRY